MADSGESFSSKSSQHATDDCPIDLQALPSKRSTMTERRDSDSVLGDSPPLLKSDQTCVKSPSPNTSTGTASSMFECDDTDMNDTESFNDSALPTSCLSESSTEAKFNGSTVFLEGESKDESNESDEKMFVDEESVASVEGIEMAVKGDQADAAANSSERNAYPGSSRSSAKTSEEKLNCDSENSSTKFAEQEDDDDNKNDVDYGGGEGSSGDGNGSRPKSSKSKSVPIKASTSKEDQEYMEAVEEDPEVDHQNDNEGEAAGGVDGIGDDVSPLSSGHKLSSSSSTSLSSTDEEGVTAASYAYNAFRRRLHQRRRRRRLGRLASSGESGDRARRNTDSSSSDSDDDESAASGGDDAELDSDKDTGRGDGGCDGEVARLVEEILSKPAPMPNWYAVRELRRREYGLHPKQFVSHFRKRVQGSTHMVKKMKLCDKLHHHEGCVNTLSFNRIGEFTLRFCSCCTELFSL